MKSRLLSILLVFLLIALIPSVSAEPAQAGAGIAFDVMKDVLNPITEKIPLFFKEQQINHLKQAREQAVKEMSDYSACLEDVKQKCLQNQEEILADYNKIIEKRKTSKIHNHPLVKTSDEMRIKKRLNDNINDYKLVLYHISGLKQKIIGLNALIDNEEKRYQDMIEDAMKGHEIMQYIKRMEDDYDVLYSVVSKIVKDNETLLEELRRR